MKTDNYLALCLEQAAKSPLHYRHGCIIVRGGKVVGQGYNDYRPGFDGGALKSGQVANGGAGGSSKQQRQDKTKSKPDLDNINFDVGSSFTPFEAIGGGAHANAPLSMHSEMMAVHSALSQSGTLACSAASHQKPCFKLPGGSKHKARLRTERIRAHVEEICRDALAQSGAASCGGQRQVQQWRFEGSSSQSGSAGSCGCVREGVQQCRQQEQRRGLAGRAGCCETPNEERGPCPTPETRPFWETETRSSSGSSLSSCA